MRVRRGVVIGMWKSGHNGVVCRRKREAKEVDVGGARERDGEWIDGIA